MAMNCCAKHHLTLNVFSKVAASDLKSYGHGICSFWYLGIAPSSFSLVSSICFPLQHTSSPFTSDQLMTTAFPLTPQKLDSTILNNRTLILLMNTLSLGEGTCLKVTAIKQELGCQSGNSDSWALALLILYSLHTYTFPHDTILQEMWFYDWNR